MIHVYKTDVAIRNGFYINIPTQWVVRWGCKATPHSSIKSAMNHVVDILTRHPLIPVKLDDSLYR